MSRLKNNYTMEEALNYCKNTKTFTILFAILAFPFPFFPPYYLGFDPRYDEHLPFYIYLFTYYVIYMVVIGKCTDKPRKVKKLVAEKAILLGCPVEIKEMGAKASNSYSTTVLVNEAMFALLKDLRVEDNVKWQKEELAVAEPYPHRYVIGSGTSGKFIDKNIPHYEKARKFGDIPTVTQSPDKGE